MANPFTVTSGTDAEKVLFTVDELGDVTHLGAVLSKGLRWGITRDGIFLLGAGGGAIPDVNLYRQAAGQLATDGDFLILTVGRGLQVKEGAGARMGTATLVSGQVTVANTSVTAKTRIFVTSQADGAGPGPVGSMRVSSRTPGVSFVISSSANVDTSVVAWLMIEPVS